jgi:hypothetical protein
MLAGRHEGLKLLFSIAIGVLPLLPTDSAIAQG